MTEAVREWRQLMKAELRLRERIHHQHRLMIGDLETSGERTEMRATLAEADHLLAQLKQLVGEV